MRLSIVVLCLVLARPGVACPSDDNTLQSFAALYPSTSTSTNVVITDARLLDVTSLDVNTIVISGTGRLVFRPGNDISIRTNSIRIQDNAELVIGSEECRFEDQVDIILKGTRTADRSDITERGEKFISVEDNASLLIFGKDKPTWTKLTATRNMPAADYKHSSDPAVNNLFRFQNGLAVTVFDSSLSRVAYSVYDFGKNRASAAQRQVDRLVSDLNGIPTGSVIAVALQHRFKVHNRVDVSTMFDAIETAAGMSTNTLALRTLGQNDAFAMVFKKGESSFSQVVDEHIGTPVTMARAAIEANGRKISAMSLIEVGKKMTSFVDFLVLTQSEGYPVLSLASDVSKWEVGDSVVITSTDYSWKHAEVRTIKSFPSTISIQLDHELMYRHFGEIEQKVDMRAEVGVLTRNIKIRGEMQKGCPAENENCRRFTYDTYGGHIKTIRSFGNLHIEGVELFHAGQPTDKGFYPIHFHMCGDVTNKEAVIKRNSIHNTFQRAVVVHGTFGTSESQIGVEQRLLYPAHKFQRAVVVHGTFGTFESQIGVEVIENVAYSVLGHAFFEEDGAERATAFRGNLAVSVQKVVNGFFSTDANKPTAFWITTPETVLVDNVAAGGEGFGIWHTFPEVPVGESASLGIYRRDEASRTPLYTTDNNVAHSNDRGGMFFDNILENVDGDVAGCMRYNPLVDPTNRRSGPSPVNLYRFTGYKNRAINLWLRGGGFKISQCSLAESRRGVQLASGGPQHQYLQDCVILGETEGNNERAEGYPDAYVNGASNFDHFIGIVFYDGPIWVSNIFLDGFKPSTESPIAAGALGFFTTNKFTSSIASTVTNIQFGKDDGAGINRVFDGDLDEDSIGGFGNFAGDELPTFRDGDGSVVGCAGTSTTDDLYRIIKPERFLETDRAVYRPNWNMALLSNKNLAGINRVFDGDLDEDSIGGFGNFAGDELPTFRDNGGSVVGCAGTSTTNDLYQIIKPERFLETDRAVYRPNWNMAWSTDLYAKIAVFLEESETSFEPIRQAKRINRNNPSDVAYETSTRDKNRAFMAVLNRTEDYFYQFQFGNGLATEMNVAGQGIARGADVIVGVCLPEGTTQEDLTVRTFTPNTNVFSSTDSGIVWVDNMEELAQDLTMSRALLHDRFLYVHMSSALERDTAWDSYDDNHCPGNGCPSFRVFLNEGAPTDYTPCFTAPTESTPGDNVARTEECLMTKGVRDESWGAGDTLGSHDGQLGQWSSWSECCNENPSSPMSTTRSRSCNSPTPHNGGADCTGSTSETKQCSTGCPVNGEWAEWSRWSDCACYQGSSGVKTRTRACEDVANGGTFCTGPSSAMTPCQGNC